MMAAVGDGHLPYLTRDLGRRLLSRTVVDRQTPRIEPMWMLLSLAALSWGIVFGILALLEWLF